MQKGPTDIPVFDKCNFTNMNFNNISIRDAEFYKCDFTGSTMHYAEFIYVTFSSCNFSKVSLRASNIPSTTFEKCFFIDSDLAHSNAEETSFTGSLILNSNLEKLNLTSSEIRNCKIKNCKINKIGISDISVINSMQQNLLIEDNNKLSLYTDDLEFSQFLNMNIKNDKFNSLINRDVSRYILYIYHISSDKAFVRNMKKRFKNKNFIPIALELKSAALNNIDEVLLGLLSVVKYVVIDKACISEGIISFINTLEYYEYSPIQLKDEYSYIMYKYKK